MKREVIRINRLYLQLLIAVFFMAIASLLIYDDFIHDSPTGNTIVIANVEMADMELCNFTLYEGWNFVSFRCIRGSIERWYALDGIVDKYDRVFTYDIFDTSDPWQSHRPELPLQYYNDLEFLNSNQGYWIYMDEETQFVLNGTLNDNMTISVRPGWNMIGYKPYDTRPLPDALWSIDGLYTEIRSYQNINGTGQWLAFRYGAAGNTLTNLSRYNGYWINMTAPGVIDFS